MTTALTQPVAKAHAEELIRNASERRVVLNSPLEPLWTPLVIRLATARDQRALKDLAELDSRPTPTGTLLMAELGGRPVAAVSLGDGEQIADPFVRTSDITELLRMRARQLQASRRGWRWPLRVGHAAA